MTFAPAPPDEFSDLTFPFTFMHQASRLIVSPSIQMMGPAQNHTDDLVMKNLEKSATTPMMRFWRAISKLAQCRDTKYRP
jgi:hypothetical protein